jgi:hypothetical protein
MKNSSAVPSCILLCPNYFSEKLLSCPLLHIIMQE